MFLQVLSTALETSVPIKKMRMNQLCNLCVRFCYGGRCKVVSIQMEVNSIQAFLFRAVWPRALVGNIVLCSWASHFTRGALFHLGV